MREHFCLLFVVKTLADFARPPVCVLSAYCLCIDESLLHVTSCFFLNMQHFGATVFLQLKGGYLLSSVN